ncbi:alpha-amylase [Streptococcus dentasini]
MTNNTLMQYFEWYLPADGKHWQRLTEEAQHLKEIGISMVWLPPAFKGTGFNDVGYGVYDLYDLGEFDQKGTVVTKYGSKDDYLKAIETLENLGIKTMADIVLNHKAGGDKRERFDVIQVNPDNRMEEVSDTFEIEAWTGFDFPGRGNTYSDFKWHWYHFTGVDYDARSAQRGIYRIQGVNKGWADSHQVDDENGNYDYLMFDDIDFEHPEVVAELKSWVRWFLETSQVSGFRLDAVKHIKADFMTDFIADIQRNVKPDLYVFAEYWKNDAQANLDYITETKGTFDLVDVVLHMNLFEASQQRENYDLSHILEGSLMQNAPTFAVTFVDNHDSQRGQALESCVEEWFKPAAYALILLRQEGLPCVFYGDYYGISGDFAQRSFGDELDTLLYVRCNHVYGEQVDYFDDANCIGWVNRGDDRHPEGVAVVISNGPTTSKRMNMGSYNAGKSFVDLMGTYCEPIELDEEGWADFPVQDQSLSVWVNQETFV